MKINKKFLIIIAVASGILLSGCQAMREQRVNDLRKTAFQRTSSPDYADGFVNGCDSAMSSHSFTKDMKRFMNNKFYNTGWTDGYMHCEKKNKEMKETSESLKKLSA